MPTRGVNFHRPVAPSSAWPGGREPREGRTRRKAVEQLLAALDRHLASHLPAVIERRLLREWVTFAARLSDTRVGVRVAPDGTEWGIRTRWDLVDYQPKAKV